MSSKERKESISEERVLHLDWMKGIAIVCMVQVTLPLLCLSRVAA